MAKALSNDALECCLQRLSSADRKELTDFWLETFGRPTPKGWSRPMLRRVIATALQTRTHGHLTKAERRTLAAALPRSSSAQRSPSDGADLTRSATAGLRPGTRLIRDWHGKTYEVTVLEGGKARLGDETYRSLSAVATAITGTRWSGPLFFGLRNRKQGQQQELALET